MTPDFVGSIEAAARSMFITMYWTRAAVESEGSRESQAYYEAIAGEYWDSGAAGESNYKGFRDLAERAVRAATSDTPPERDNTPTEAVSVLRKYEPQVTNSKTNSGLDSRFGAFIPSVSHTQRDNRIASDTYRRGWLKPPDPKIIVYL
jgi:hypothetical protein